MRHDMAKVVTERPRGGHGNRSQKHGGRLHPDEYDRDDHRAGLIPWSRHRNPDCKEFSDLIGPLRRYLRKQVGRPWNHVWSDLSATLDKRSLTGSHIFDHIKQEVSTECWMGVSGTVYYDRRYAGTVPVDGLYVHPFTGLLCFVPKRRYGFDQAGYAFRAKLKRFGFVFRDAAEPAIIRRRYYVSGRRAGGDVTERAPDAWRLFRIADESTVWERRPAGWFIHTFREQDPLTVVKVLTREGRDDVPSYLGPGHLAWVSCRAAGRKDLKRARALLTSPPY